MIRAGNTFGMDYSRNRGGLYPFIAGSPMSNSSALSSMNHFPPQRLQANFPNQIGVQTSLNILSEIAMGEGAKRVARADLGSPDAKRFKHSHTSAGDPKKNPMLMERLAAMSGGFPMPKWAMEGKTTKPQPTQTVANPSQVLPKHGAFPMPRKSEESPQKLATASLNSYKKLWQETDADLREEVLARRLGRDTNRLAEIKVKEMGHTSSC